MRERARRETMVDEEKSWGPEFMLHTKISLLSYQIEIKN